MERNEIPELARSDSLPETPHDLPFNRAVVDEVVTSVRAGTTVDLLEATLDAIDWSSFGTAGGGPLDPRDQDALRRYYREKWSDIGPLFLAELLSTEFMTEQRARGDIVFSERLLQLGRSEPELWHEIRQFFRRKETVTALLAAAHRPSARNSTTASEDEDEEDLWE